MIPEGNVVKFIASYKDAFCKIHLSFFEMTVGMAFDYFREEKVDIAIIETGMGGRLDSTNVLNPLLSVITNIGYDHTQFLGESLQEIAGEKAAIIKAGIPSIVGETQEDIKNVFTDRAKNVGSKLIFADQEFSAEFEPSLSGDWQKKNLVTVIAAIHRLKSKGFIISEENIRDGIQKVIINTGLKGRWQILKNTPLAICDIGHNLDGIREVLKMIEKTPHKKLHFVLGLVADKNVEPVLNIAKQISTGGRMQ